jgi:hypothetical protein
MAVFTNASDEPYRADTKKPCSSSACLRPQLGQHVGITEVAKGVGDDHEPAVGIIQDVLHFLVAIYRADGVGDHANPGGSAVHNEPFGPVGELYGHHIARLKAKM